MNRIARFMRVSRERFEADWADAFPGDSCPWETLRLPERATSGSAGYDFFAVSMPELEVYQDDIQKRSDDYCRRLMQLGHKGLEAMESFFGKA